MIFSRLVLTIAVFGSTAKTATALNPITCRDCNGAFNAYGYDGKNDPDTMLTCLDVDTEGSGCDDTAAAFSNIDTISAMGYGGGEVECGPTNGDSSIRSTLGSDCMCTPVAAALTEELGAGFTEVECNPGGSNLVVGSPTIDGCEAVACALNALIGATDPNCLTPAPTPAPTAAPTPAPTAAPTPAPTTAPTPQPTPAPTAAPTPAPTAATTASTTTASTTTASTTTASTTTAAPTATPPAAATDASTSAPIPAPTDHHHHHDDGGGMVDLSPTATPTDAATGAPISAPTPAPTGHHHHDDGDGRRYLAAMIVAWVFLMLVIVAASVYFCKNFSLVMARGAKVQPEVMAVRPSEHATTVAAMPEQYSERALEDERAAAAAAVDDGNELEGLLIEMETSPTGEETTDKAPQ